MTARPTQSCSNLEQTVVLTQDLEGGIQPHRRQSPMPGEPLPAHPASSSTKSLICTECHEVLPRSRIGWRGVLKPASLLAKSGCTQGHTYTPESHEGSTNSLTLPLGVMRETLQVH
jgi:hypothetical protein